MSVIAVGLFAQKVHIYTIGSVNEILEDNFVEIGYSADATLGIDAKQEEFLVDESSTTKNIVVIQRDNQTVECCLSVEEDLIGFPETFSFVSRKDSR